MSKPYHRNPDQIISDSTKRCVAIRNFTYQTKSKASCLGVLLIAAVITTTILAIICTL